MISVREYDAKLNDLEARLRRLRIAYDQWFAGIDRVEPQQMKKQFESLQRSLSQNQPRNTASRFRFQQIKQRYATYITYWSRIARQIEEGTYRRDVLRARRQRDEREMEAPPPVRGAVEVDLDDSVDDALREAQQAAEEGSQRAITPFAMPTKDGNTAKRAFPKPAGARAAAAKNARAQVGGGVSQEKIDSVYKRFIDARSKNSERTDNVRPETIAKSIAKMLPKLQQKHAGKQIDFDVVVRNGKVALKPIAK